VVKGRSDEVPELRARSLAGLHPGRWYVPLGLAAALGLLITGLMLPVMRIERLIFWEDYYSIVTGAFSLYNNGHPFLAVILFAFSVVFPNLKLIGLLAVWFVPMGETRRNRFIRWVDVLGRWSMLDVFVVAVMIVLTQSRSFLDAEARAGLYVFSGAVVLSMVMTIAVERVAKGTRPTDPVSSSAR
jgi:paraquat-inducible protein A